MAVKDKLTKEEYEALDPGAQGFYKPGPKAEGGAETFVLDSPEAAGLAAKLKARDEAIAKLAKENEERERRFAELEKRFEGIDVEKARLAMAEAAERERGDYIKKNDIPGLLAAEEKKWKDRHEKDLAAIREEKEAVETDLHQLLILDGWRREVTAGAFEDNGGRRELPVIMSDYLGPAESDYIRRFKPKVIVEKAEDGTRRRRAVATVDGIEKDMNAHIRDEWLPAVQKIFCQQPQHSGGDNGNTKPARSVAPGGAPQEIPREQAHTKISDLAAGKVYVSMAS